MFRVSGFNSLVLRKEQHINENDPENIVDIQVETVNFNIGLGAFELHLKMR